MMYGIIIQSVVPYRAEPSHRSEMVSQMLFGEKYSVLEQRGEWLRIQLKNDAYVGWIWEKQHHPLDESEFQSTEPLHMVQDYFQPLRNCVNQSVLIIPLGSELCFRDEQHICAGNTLWKADRLTPTPFPKVGPKTLVKKAMLYLESPYLWGGKTPWGIDCSGLTQMAFKLCGKHIPRDAKEQAMQGSVVDFVEEAQEGDLAFFHNENGEIVHVGMICGERKILHASGKVRIDTLDYFGIYNHEVKKYTHFLRIIKRLL